jgi:hypothetical protein
MHLWVGIHSLTCVTLCIVTNILKAMPSLRTNCWRHRPWRGTLMQTQQQCEQCAPVVHGARLSAGYGPPGCYWIDTFAPLEASKRATNSIQLGSSLSYRLTPVNSAQTLKAIPVDRFHRDAAPLRALVAKDELIRFWSAKVDGMRRMAM